MSSEARPVVACIKRIEQCQSERLGSDRITGFTGHAKTPRGPSCMMSGGRRQVVSPPIAHHADRHASTQALWQAQAHGRQAVWGCTWLPKWKYIDTRPISQGSMPQRGGAYRASSSSYPAPQEARSARTSVHPLRGVADEAFPLAGACFQSSYRGDRC